ncbi:hypothetical protein SHKM778_19210 [Streptomyces sp. KM77-8]|uniref:ABC transporter type 1 GsiC-like N-terminal domain-containing protein n=1 Tax=Streptomyces haneummycinicus TaxID=3074435 RepID=A0AAT9HDP4_9ACTN
MARPSARWARLSDPGEKATEAEVVRINRALGLDQPVYIQYGRFLKRIFQLDLGTSTQTGQPVWDEFVLRFPATVELSLLAILIAVVVGVPSATSRPATAVAGST